MLVKPASLILTFISYTMEEEFSKTYDNTRIKRAALEKTRLPKGPHYPIVVEVDFRVTPHVTRMLLGERFLNLRPDTFPDQYVKSRLRTLVGKLEQVVFCGIAPLATSGYPIIVGYDLSN